MFVLGLTGSIGMGKSTVSMMFQDLGIPVLGADEIVHDLYQGGAAVAPLADAFPTAVDGGVVSRPELSKLVANDKEALKRLEAIVHPLVTQERHAWLWRLQREGVHSLAVLDIPLLYETGAESHVDAVVVVSAPAEVQRQRVLQRPGMTEGKFEYLLSRQMPDEEKCKRAEYVLNTGVSLEETREHVHALVLALKGRMGRLL